MHSRLPAVLACLALSTIVGCTEPASSDNEQSPRQASAKLQVEVPQAAPKPAPETEQAPSTEPTSDATPASSTPPTAEPPPPGATLEAAKDGFELLAAGTAPLRALRFAPRAGQVETNELTMEMAMSIVGPGMPTTAQRLPPIEQINRTETLSVNDGRIEVKLVLEGFSVGPGANPQAAELMQATMKQLEGFEQVMVFDDRGGVVEGELQIPPGTTPQLAQTLTTMSKTFAQVMVRLPEVPVGVGASWRETHAFDNNGMQLEQTSQFELVAADGDHITLDTQITQRPLTTTFSPPNMPGSEVELVDFDSHGSGQIAYDLSKMMPDRVSTKVETKFGIETEVMGQSHTLTTEISLDLTVERVEAD